MSTKKVLFLIAFSVSVFSAYGSYAQTVEEAVKKTVNDTAKTAIEEVESEVKDEVKNKKEKRKEGRKKKDKNGAVESEKDIVKSPESSAKSEPVVEQSNSETLAEEKNNNETPVNVDRTQAYLEEFKKLDVSYIGSTQNCVGYNVYAIKYRRTWFLATNVNESPALSVFVERPPRTEEVFPAASPFLVEGLKGILVNQYAKKKHRRKKVKDLQLYGFYKLKRPGKQAAKGLLLIEYPKELNKEPEFFLFKMFYDMFNKKKEELKPDPNIQKQFEDKLKVPMDKAKEEISTVAK
ncbi:hypothetical protein JMN32_05830 [Fulvivirga sp. 29W222]|uniref:Uncharacterized protein n=1 Tax=Fulvivirga marina TaxID=2494733 RepID=A0A937KAQ1_9BACT|nr:hypothetical protein [Fulvivirga marina]MBL6445816.1 hypothetical protein [Fulvivirga marina]